MTDITTISCQGDRDYVLKLRVLAAVRNQRVGDMVRQALDEKYGQDMASIAPIFFGQNETKMSHSKRKRSKKVTKAET
jgi:hypothetical protein